MPEIKAITLHQPWASLVAKGAKKYETRSWFNGHLNGDLIAIHAGKKWTNGLAVYINQFKVFQDALKDANDQITLPLGFIICICRFEGCYKITKPFIDQHITAQEKEFGNYEIGRYAWKLGLVHVLDEPIACSGKQGVWRWQYPDQLKGIINGKPK